MHILCPHCRNPIEIVKLDPRAEIPCPSCGSSFHLEGESTVSWSPGAAQRLGKFEIIEQVGNGAFGTVYKARDPELDRIVAIKVPRAGNLPEPQDLDRFLREARSAAQLRHPSIVSVHEVGSSDKVPYLVSDFVDGMTLSDLLTAKRPNAQESARLVAGIADALQYAHDQGVVHRDVKPSNIMIGPDGVPCVMDFGLAKREAGEITMTVDGQVLGTPAYMSPEQARGESHRVDGRSDVYSLGVILYQLLTGELPFRGNMRMLLHQVLHDEPRLPRKLNDHVPRDLETICLKAMAKEPARRYSSARSFAEDLRRFLNGEPIQARPVGRFERTWRWCRRNPSAAGLAAAIMLFASCAFAGALWYVSDRAERRAEQSLRSNQVEREIVLALEAAVKRRDEAFQKSDRPEIWQAGLIEAFAELRRAEAMLTGEQDRVGAGVVAQVHDLRTRLDSDDAERQRASQLENIRIEAADVVDGRHDPYKIAPKKYAEEFRKAGIDMATEDTTVLAERIKRSPIRSHLVAALDEWAYWIANETILQRWLDIARLVDPDHWRDQFRDRQVWMSKTALEALAADPLLKNQPTHVIVLVGRRLDALNGRAEPVMRLAQGRDPSDFWANYSLGLYLRFHGKADEAEGYYRAALALRPRNALMYNDLGWTLGLQHKYAEAVAAYEKAIEIDSKFALAYNSLGVALKGQKKWTQAIAAFQRAIELDPAWSAFRHNLGHTLIDEKRVAEAIAVFRNAIDFDPNDAVTYRGLGRALFIQLEFSAASTAFLKAIDLNPKSAVDYYNLAIALDKQKKLPEAIAAYQKAIELDPKDAIAHYNLGNALLSQKKLPEAIAAYQKAIDLDPKHKSTYSNLGNALLSQKKLPEAIAAYQKAIDLDPKYAQSYGNLGIALYDQKKLPEAIAAYQKAIDLDPKDALAYLGLGNALRDQNKLSEAIAAFRAAIKNNAEFAEALCNLGHCLRRNGEFSEALTFMKRGHEIGTKRPFWNFGRVQLPILPRICRSFSRRQVVLGALMA